MSEGILERDKRRMQSALQKRLSEKDRKIEHCKRQDTHDTSHGNFYYIYGTIHASVSLNNCRVGIEVSGECPSCHHRYKRRPTIEEMQTQEYQEMIIQLDTYEKVQEMLDRPMTI